MRLATAIVALATSIAAHGGVFRVTTGQQGAQVQLDVSHTHDYVITPALQTSVPGSLDFILGGVFEMKAGPSSTHDLSIALYQALLPLPANYTSGSDVLITPVGAALATRTLTNAEFCAQPGVTNCQSFATHTFDFVTPIELNPLLTYFLRLESAQPADQQNQAYFIKEPNPYVLSFIQEFNPPIPEPSTFGLAAFGLAAAAWFARRR